MCLAANTSEKNMTEWIYKETGKDKPCDIFIAAPTVGLETKYGNNNIHDPQIRHFFKMALDMEKGIFEDSCCMFAPYYRQATMPVFYLDDDNQKPFNRIAYNDIKEAFLDYYCNYNNGSCLLYTSDAADEYQRV